MGQVNQRHTDPLQEVLCGGYPANTHASHAFDTIATRRFLLLQNSPEEIVSYAKEVIFPRFAQALRVIYELTDDLHIQYLSNLLIALSRSWEVFHKDDNGQYLFSNWINNLQKVQTEILRNTATLEIAMTPVSISYISVQNQPCGNSSQTFEPSVDVLDCIHQAKFQFLENFDIISFIVPNITKEIIVEFLREQLLVKFEVYTDLAGLSSYDGKTVFLNWALIGNDPKELRITVEHELVHNFARWIDCKQRERDIKSEKVDPRQISPIRNKRLRFQNDELMEAGDFYEWKVYGKHPIFYPNPFGVRWLPTYVR